MYRTYATPLQLDIQSSRQLIIGLATIFFLVVISVLFASLAFYFKFLFLLVFLFLFLAFPGCKNINHKKIIIWKEDSEWKIVEEGMSQNARLLASSFISQWLSILNFELDNKKKKTVLVFADAINKEQFRKLRVRLKVDGL